MILFTLSISSHDFVLGFPKGLKPTKIVFLDYKRISYPKLVGTFIIQQKLLPTRTISTGCGLELLLLETTKTDALNYKLLKSNPLEIKLNPYTKNRKQNKGDESILT